MSLLQLLECGRLEFTDQTLSLAAADSPTAWFQQSDWNRLLALGLGKDRLAFALAESPHPQAYMPSLRWLLGKSETGAEDIAAVRRFLEADNNRLLELRVEAAAWLWDLFMLAPALAILTALRVVRK